MDWLWGKSRVHRQKQARVFGFCSLPPHHSLCFFVNIIHFYTSSFWNHPSPPICLMYVPLIFRVLSTIPSSSIQHISMIYLISDFLHDSRPHAGKGTLINPYERPFAFFFLYLPTLRYATLYAHLSLLPYLAIPTSCLYSSCFSAFPPPLPSHLPIPESSPHCVSSPCHILCVIYTYVLIYPLYR